MSGTFLFVSPAGWAMFGFICLIAFIGVPLAVGQLLRRNERSLALFIAELDGQRNENEALRDDLARLRRERGNVRAIAEAWETVSWDAWQYIESHDWTEN